MTTPGTTNPAHEQNPLVSVVIPTCNRANLLPRAILSVLAQTLQSFEVIIVDDGSTDNTNDVPRSFNDPRIHYVRHESTRGVDVARNTGLSRARGTYVAILDDDDEWMPGMLERSVGVLSQSPPEVAFVFTGGYQESDGRLVTRTPQRDLGSLRRDLLKWNYIWVNAAVFKRSLIQAIGGFDEALPAWGDLDLWLRTLKQHKALAIAEPLVVVHTGGTRPRMTTDIRLRIEAREILYNRYRPDLDEAGLRHVWARNQGRDWQRVGGVDWARHSRLWYREAIRTRPWSLYGYTLYATTYLPTRLVHGLALIKRKITTPIRRRALSQVEVG